MADDPKATVRLRDVAEAAGVSQGTASNAFSRPDLVSEALRERVRAAALRLGYRGPSVQGRLLRAKTVNAIGVATTLPLSYFFDDPWSRAVVSAFVGTAAGVGRGCAGAAAMRAVKASVAARARSISSSRRLDINRE